MVVRTSLDQILAPLATPSGATVRLRYREIAGSRARLRRAVPPAIQVLVVVLAPVVPGKVAEGAATPVGATFVLQVGRAPS